jgi:hypothetical protein
MSKSFWRNLDRIRDFHAIRADKGIVEAVYPVEAVTYLLELLDFKRPEELWFPENELSDYERATQIENRFKRIEGDPLDLEHATMLRSDMRWLLSVFWKNRRESYRKARELRKRIDWIAENLEDLAQDEDYIEWSKVTGQPVNPDDQSGRY